jgi:VWFA-related protein
MDWAMYPISLVVAMQTSANSGAVVDKVGGSGILFTQLLAADAGETALLTFSDDVRLHQDFTAKPDPLTHALRMLRMEGDDAHILDAMNTGLDMLEKRRPGRRRILLMISERRDRGSAAKLVDVMERAQRLNVSVYWLTWSPFVQPFTAKPRTMEDLKPEAQRIKGPPCLTCPDTRGAPFDVGPGGLIYAIGELARLKQPDLPDLFTRGSGGRALNFVKKNALEQAIQLVGQEVHRQYLLSFQPRGATAGSFHAIRVVVRDRPDLQVRTRAGYWAIE